MKKLLYILLILSLGQNSSADNKNVLFIGNSYTYYNNLPDVINSIANSFGDTLFYDSNTPGGLTAQGHWNNATTLTKIQQGGWDYVSIQCQSQEPSFSAGQVASQTFPYVKSLDSLVQASNSCAETIYFMTWGRKNGDQANCPLYPPVCTYDGMQQRLRESYLLFADSTNASVSPVGAAWKIFRTQYPNIDLYSPDESHPSLHGTYLAACVFYSSLFHKSSSGSTYVPGGISAIEASYIQDVASALVLDSLEYWQGNGSIPFANYNFSNNGTLYSFNNTSLRAANYSWDFDDGTPLNTNQNPNHIFNGTGSFTVCLRAISNCGKISKRCQQFTVNPLGLKSLEKNDKIFSIARTLFIKIDEAFNLKIVDLSGRIVLDQKDAQKVYSLDFLKKGLYNATIHVGNKNTYRHKFLVY